MKMAEVIARGTQVHRATARPQVAHPSRGNGREGRPVTARKRTLALSRSLAARARAEV